MSPRIRILPENLCNKIAAGEVVERPASVVKELVENALDAGSGEIVVELEAGGKRLIRVSDDGTGMDRDDLMLAVERHATSKISTDEDLFRLHTLGFRGEALPSIAAVSRLTLSSRSADAELGWEVYLEGGTVRRSAAAGLPRGTLVEVRNLFFNTPARRKFLRRDESELGHVGDVVTKIALAHAEVRFRMVHNGRALIDVPKTAALEERVASLLGRPLVKDLLAVQAEGEGGLALHGLVAEPGQNRSTGNAVYTFINGRYIRDRVVQHAVLEGYRNLLMKGRHPVAVLFLDIDPVLVDVNVHPTKHEVRFRDQRRVHDFIAETLRERLAPAAWISAPETDHVGAATAVPSAPRAAANETRDRSAGADRYRERVGEALVRYGEQAPLAGMGRGSIRGADFGRPAPADDGGPDAEKEKGFFASLKILGQFRRSYILCEDGDDLLLIDQHAAHERIGFERLKEQLADEGIERQMLLFPAVLDLDFREAAVL